MQLGLMQQAEESTTSEHVERGWAESSKACAETKHRAIDALCFNYHDSAFLVGHRKTPKVSCAKSCYKSSEVHANWTCSGQQHADQRVSLTCQNGLMLVRFRYEIALEVLAA